LNAPDDESEHRPEALDGTELALGDGVDDFLEPVQVEGHNVVFDHLLEVDGGFELGGDFLHEWSGLFLHRCGGDDFEAGEGLVVDETAEKGKCAKLRPDALPNEVVGGAFEMGAELDFADFVENHVLLEDFALDDLCGFGGELLLAGGDESLPFPKEHAHRFPRMEKHLDRDPVGQPADGGGDEGSEEQKDHAGIASETIRARVDGKWVDRQAKRRS